jgi:long-chain acyl-CoA synthetase
VAALASGEPLSPAREVFVEVARTVAKVAGNISAAEVAPHHKLQMDLGIDSIGRVDLLQHLEAHFSITLPPECEDKILTVQDVVALVEGAAGAEVRSKPKRTRHLWERARLKQDVLAAGLQLSPGRLFLRSIFDALTSLIMETHVRVRGDGLDNLPVGQPYILVANHSSHLDLPSIRKVVGGSQAARLHAMAAKDYFFDTRFKRWFFTTFLNALPLDREANAAESLAVCKTVLDSGRSILLFPEGTRTLTGELQPFKPGIGVLALELNYPIVPVWLHGTYDALPKGRIIPRPGRIEVRIGKPVDFSAMRAERDRAPSSDLFRRAAAELRARVEELAELKPMS